MISNWYFIMDFSNFYCVSETNLKKCLNKFVFPKPNITYPFLTALNWHTGM